MSIMSSKKRSSSNSSGASMDAANVKIVDLPNFTDADPSHMPKDNAWALVDPPTLYLRKCGEQWMSSQAPRKKIKGIAYYLNALPTGYRLYEKARPSNPNTVDKFLYGHPKGKSTHIFNSPAQFYPHFEHLQLNKGSSIGCPCARCSPASSRSTKSEPSVKEASPVTAAIPEQKPALLVKHKPGRPPGPGKTAASRGQGPQKPSFVSGPQRYLDEEDTPNTIANMMERLRSEGRLDEPIEENYSMDWIASSKEIETLHLRLKDQKACLPRCGEVVLFCRHLQDHQDISYDAVAAQFKIYDNLAKRFLGLPYWEAGVVALEPKKRLSIYDVLSDEPRTETIETIGFRIEPLPRPGHMDKSLTTRHKFIEMRAIRPLSLYEDILQGIPHEDWHETIANALLISSSVNVVGKYGFSGVWPEVARIACYGVFMGAEYISVGDFVRYRPRLLPGEDDTADILEITKIRWESSDLAVDEPHANERIRFYGLAYTLNSMRAKGKNKQKFNRAELPSILQPLSSPVYRVHDHEDERKPFMLSLERIIGRIFEYEAIRLWLPGNEDPLAMLTVGDAGTSSARVYARQNDARILEGKNWFLADDRLEALDVRSLNGVESWRYDNLREERTEAGHKAAKVLARPSAKNMAEMREVAERPKDQGALAMRRASRPVDDVKEEEPEEHSTSGSGSTKPKPEELESTNKRSIDLTLSSDDSGSDEAQRREPITEMQAEQDSGGDSAEVGDNGSGLLQTFQPNKRPKLG